MTDLTELEREITDLLAERAASASPPADAWDRLVAELSYGPVGADSSIDTFDDYTGEAIMTTLETDQRAEKSRPAYRSPLGIAAAVLLVVALGAAALLATRDDGTDAPVTQSQGVTVDFAFEVNEAYFAAYNAGDADAVLALFTDDATFSSGFSGLESQTDVDQTDWDLELVWDLAQGTNLLPSPECTLIEEVPGVAVTISCEHGTLDSLVQAVDSRPVPTTTIMTVTPAGIGDLSEGFGRPDFNDVGIPFADWMEANHPADAVATGCCAGDTFEESVARGELRAAYAKEWALYLEANDCTYGQRC
jgi:hypothetical protein